MEQFIKRLKSFAWRAVMVGIIAALAWVIDNLGILELPVYVQGILGLMLGEVSKYLNTGVKQS